jgi:hypothetical protein
MENYYVYCHRNPITNEIFYIGKGTKHRAYVKQNRGKHWNNYVKKHGIPLVEILYDNLNEDESLILEKKLIKTFGRKELNNGGLVNSTDGGEGCSGLVHSDEVKKIISECRKNKPGNNKGKKFTHKNKRIKGLKRGKYKTRKDKGKIFSDDIKQKFSESKRNKSKIILQYDIKNNFIKEWRSVPDIVDDLGVKGVYNCLKGYSKSSGGFIWKYKE